MADTDAVEQIARFLTSKGLTPAQVAGITGNLYVESKYNSSAHNSGEGAIGIAQWRLGRRTALQAFAAARGGKETDLGIQLLFLWHELATDPNNGLAELRATTTPAAAATVFDQRFERSDGKARADRISKAETIYGVITTPGWKYGNPGNWTDPGPSIGNSGPMGGGSGVTGQPVGLIGDIGGSLLSSATAGIGRLVIKSVFIIGGIAIVGIGLAQAVRPAVTKAKDAAVTVVQTAKSASPASAL